MSREAYAVGFIDTTTEPPRIRGVGIYSANAGSIATDQRRAFPFDIAGAWGDDYGHAEKNLREYLARFAPWALALINGNGAIQ